MRVYVLGSGSTGNALLVEAGQTRILVDAGIGPRVAARRMALLGAQLFPRGVDAIFVTHHHGDHAAHAEPLARALRVPLYLHDGIAATRVRSRYEVRRYAPGEPLRVKDVEVTAVAVPHDAPQVALGFHGGGRTFAVATDLGRVPSALERLLAGCDAALVESNYCPRMLAEGPYPPHLQRRLTGGRGHLANEETAALAAKLVGTRLARLYLGHLSRTNNTPERALAVVRSRAAGLPVEVVQHGASRVLDVTPGARPSAGYVQLGLALDGAALGLP